jgi:hypothetical protein
MRKIPVFIAAATGAAMAIFLLSRQINYSIYIPSTYRVIYVPLYFWLLCAAYLFITHALFLKGVLPLVSYLKKGAIPLFALHLYILLGNLIIKLSDDRGELAGAYLLYIAAVFLISTAALTFFAVKRIAPFEKNHVFEPMAYFPFLAAVSYFFLFNMMSGRHALGAATGLFAGLGALSAFARFEGLCSFIGRAYSDDLKLVVFIFLVAFCARALFGINLVYKTTHGPQGYNGYLYASDDGDAYDGIANRILKDPSVLKRGEVEIWGNWDGFYGVLLGGFYRIFGRNFYIAVCAQAIFGALIPASIFLMGKMLFSRMAGFIAAVFLSLKGGIIIFSSYMGHEAVWLPLLYVFLSLLTYYFKEPARSGIFRDAAMGATLGLVVLFRSMYLYFLPFLIFWETVFFRNIKIVKKMAHLVVIVSLSAAVVLAAFLFLHNTFKPMNSEKAQYLWHSSRLSPPFQYLGNERFEAMGINFFGDPKGSFNAICRNPFKFAILAAKIYPLRIVAYLETFQFGYFDPIYMVNPAKTANAFASTVEFYFTLFFLIGVAMCLFKRGVLSSPIFLVLVFHVLFYGFILAHPSPRLKETSAPIVYLIGSVGACGLFRYLKGAPE